MKQNERDSLDLLKKKFSENTDDYGHHLLELLSSKQKNENIDFFEQNEYIKIAMDFFMKIMKKKNIKEKDITLENKNKLIAEVIAELNTENIGQITKVFDEYASPGKPLHGRADQLYFLGAQPKTLSDFSLFYLNIVYERDLLLAQKKFFETNKSPDTTVLATFLNGFQLKKPGRNTAIPKVTDLIVVPTHSVQGVNK